MARTPIKRKDGIADPFAQPPRQPELAPRPNEVASEVVDAAKPGSKIAVYSPIEEGLRLMHEKHGHVLEKAPVVTKADELAPVKENLRELVTFRTTLEKTRKEEKAASLAYGSLVDAEARRIQTAADRIESVYAKAVKDWETKEAARVSAIHERIKVLRETPSRAIGKTLLELQGQLSLVVALQLHTFEEFREQAAAAQVEAERQLRIMVGQAEQAEADRLERDARLERDKRNEEVRALIVKLAAPLAMIPMCRTADRLQQLHDNYRDSTPGILTEEIFGDQRAQAVVEAGRVLGVLATALAEKRKLEAAEAENVRLRALVATAPPPPAPAPAPAADVYAGVGSTSTDGLPPDDSQWTEEQKDAMRKDPKPAHVFNMLPTADGHVDDGADEPLLDAHGMPDLPTLVEMADALADTFNDHPVNLLVHLQSFTIADFGAALETLHARM